MAAADALASVSPAPACADDVAEDLAAWTAWTAPPACASCAEKDAEFESFAEHHRATEAIQQSQAQEIEKLTIERDDLRAQLERLHAEAED